jgi:hypothetical protein
MLQSPRNTGSVQPTAMTQRTRSDGVFFGRKSRTHPDFAVPPDPTFGPRGTSVLTLHLASKWMSVSRRKLDQFCLFHHCDSGVSAGRVLCWLLSPPLSSNRSVHNLLLFIFLKVRSHNFGKSFLCSTKLFADGLAE